MAKKILILGVTLIMALGLFAGCGNKTYYVDRVIVVVKTEYKEKFLAEEFSVEDFEWSNVKKIESSWWSVASDTGYITVLLKKHGKKRVDSAIKHFETLDFVAYASHYTKILTF